MKGWSYGIKSLKTNKFKSKAIEIGLDQQYKNPANAKLRITFWMDGDLLKELRKQASEVGAGYQTYMHKMLRDAIMGKGFLESRIEALERKLKRGAG